MGDVKANYAETQQELYSLGDTVCDNLEKSLGDFAIYKIKYDSSYLNGVRTLITTARALPNVDQRQDVFQSKRVEMKKVAEKCLENFPFLQGYINDAYEKDLREIKYESAGGNYYKTAKYENWEDVRGMNDAMIYFISKNTADLSTKGYMPAAFASKVEDNSKQFNILYGEFKTARETSAITAAKITANNHINAEISSIMEDGRLRVYMNDAEKAKEFTRKDLMFIISPPGSASLKVKTLGKGTNLPLVATIAMQKEGGTPIQGTTNEDGETLFPNIDPGVYSGTITSSNMQTYTFEKDVDTGVDARLVVYL